MKNMQHSTPNPAVTENRKSCGPVELAPSQLAAVAGGKAVALGNKPVALGKPWAA